MSISFWQRDITGIIPHFKNKKKISVKELAVFCRKLSFLLDAGVPVKNAVLLVAAQSPVRFREKLNDTHAHIMRGDGLSAALKCTGMFPSFMCGLVFIGELSAKLPFVMLQLVDYYEQQAKMESELKAALIYPAVVACMMMVMLIIVFTFVLPNYGRVFVASNVPLPMITQVLLGVSDFITGYPYIVLSLFFALVILIKVFFKSKAADYLRLYIPFYKNIINLRFTQALSLMLLSGQTLSTAIPACLQVLGNSRAQNDMHIVADRIKEGKSFWESLNQIPYMDAFLISMAQVGEGTGRLPQTMEKCQSYFNHTYQQDVKRLGKLIEPMITIVLGLVLGMVMLAVILPTFTLMDLV